MWPPSLYLWGVQGRAVTPPHQSTAPPTTPHPTSTREEKKMAGATASPQLSMATCCFLRLPGLQGLPTLKAQEGGEEKGRPLHFIFATRILHGRG